MATQSRATSMRILQKRLTEAEDQRLQDLTNTSDRGLDKGFMMNGVGSSAWRAYADKMNREGEIARLRDAIGGGSGQLDLRAGTSRVIDSPEPAAGASPAVQQLGQKAFTVLRGEDEYRDRALSKALFEKAMAEAGAGRERAEAARRDAVISQDPREGFIGDQYQRGQATEDMLAKGRAAQQLGREGLPLERDQILNRGRAEWDLEAEQWQDPIAADMRQYKRRLAEAPAQARAQGQVDVAAINRDAKIQAALLQIKDPVAQENIRGLHRTLQGLDQMNPNYDNLRQYYEAKINEALAAHYGNPTAGAGGAAIRQGLIDKGYAVR
jgi:hypothetical protein